MAALLFLCSLPVLSVLVAGTAAKLLGCTLNEGDIHPCYLLGVPIGGLLYVLGVLGWLMMVSLPLAALLILVWIAVESVRFIRKRKAR